MQETVWQPENLYQPSYEFGIKLDADFAREISSIDVPQGYKENLNDFSEDILEEFNYSRANPLNFYEDTFLITGIYLGNNGTWISTESAGDIAQRNDDLEYNSHNVDTSNEAYALMSLFGNWADKAAILEK